MQITDFTQNKAVKKIVAQLRSDQIDRKPFSDLLDSAGNQYIELVQEGGGVLGVALIGYTFVLEQITGQGQGEKPQASRHPQGVARSVAQW